MICTLTDIVNGANEFNSFLANNLVFSTRLYRFTYQAIINATFSVDSFFFMRFAKLFFLNPSSLKPFSQTYSLKDGMGGGGSLDPSPRFLLCVDDRLEIWHKC